MDLIRARIILASQKAMLQQVNWLIARLGSDPELVGYYADKPKLDEIRKAIARPGIFKDAKARLKEHEAAMAKGQRGLFDNTQKKGK